MQLMEFTYNNSYHGSIGINLYETFYRRRYRMLVCWIEVGERKLEGSEMVQHTTNKIQIIKGKLKVTQDRQKLLYDLVNMGS